MHYTEAVHTAHNIRTVYLLDRSFHTFVTIALVTVALRSVGRQVCCVEGCQGHHQVNLSPVDSLDIQDKLACVNAEQDASNRQGRMCAGMLEAVENLE